MRIQAFIIGIMCSVLCRADGTYHFFVDLTKVHNDKIKVVLAAPTIISEEIIYRLPKIVPGTYEVYNFGRFVSAFKAFDKAGVELKVEHLDANSWKISNANKLRAISYEVEDSWDTDQKEDYIFEPAGSNFEDGKNFLLNTHCLFGYFEGWKFLPYEINVTHPDKFYGSTGLIDVSQNNNTDTFFSSDYVSLVDSPIMYCVPDTSIIEVGGAKVLVSVYSQQKKTNSKFISGRIKTILEAQKEYLGGKLPIQKYAFIIYLFNGMSRSGATGALEHSYSSVYFLPESDPEYLASNITSVAAHEFFHIVTPLSIHSEEIGDFDFNEPRMSQHLWLYEGVTEYFAGHVQLKSGLITLNEYLKLLRQKLLESESYIDTLPFTELSKFCLKKYKEQYPNVYEKGALIGFCMDVLLLNYSEGKYSMINLLEDLSRIYGKNRAFQDDELIGQITKMTYPEIGDFLNRHVKGNVPLPLVDILRLVGVEYVEKEHERSTFIFDLIPFLYSFESNNLIVKEENENTEKFGLKRGDEIVKINGKKISLGNLQDLYVKFSKIKVGDKIKFNIRRKDDFGGVLKEKINTVGISGLIDKKYILRMASHPTEKQLLIRKAWMGRIE